MTKHPILGWPPPPFMDEQWHRELDDTLAAGRTSLARRCLQGLRRTSAPGLRSARVAVLRTFSLELSECLLALAFTRWQVLPRFSWFDFNSFEGELLDSGSRLHRLHREQSFDFIVLGWRLKDWLPEVWSNPTEESRSAILASSLDRVSSILEAATAIAPVVCFPFDDHSTDAPLPAGRVLQRLLIAEHHAHVLAWCARQPERSAVIEMPARPGQDRKAEAFSHQPFSPSGQVQIAVSIAKACAPWLQPAAKVLALDADGTLWGGIVGEDGPAGVQIGREFPGNLYRELQIRAKFLKQGGILLALVSRNDEAAVAGMFATDRGMPLVWQDFSAWFVNWDDKTTNLRRAAEELNLGLSSFVFLDDSPFERAMIRAQLPQVRVPEVPDILAMLDYLESGVDFLKAGRGREDAVRAADYVAQREREALRVSAPSTEAFLESLELVATIREWSKETLPRIADMLKKTTQFNLTTRRHSLSQLEMWLTGNPEEAYWGCTLSARDRFADQGLVGCLLARHLRDGQWDLDSFLLSCRAFGRGYETALLRCALRKLKERGATTVAARYVPSERNELVRDFYPRHGAHSVGIEGAALVFQFDLTENGLNLRAPDWIRVEESDRV